MEDELGNALRVTGRVGDGNGAALRDAEEGEALQLKRVDHRLEVPHERLE